MSENKSVAANSGETFGLLGRIILGLTLFATVIMGLSRCDGESGEKNSSSTATMDTSSSQSSDVVATRATPALRLRANERAEITGQAVGLWLTMYKGYTLRVWPKNGAMAEVVFIGDREVSTVEGVDPSTVANGRLIDKIRWLQEGVEVCIFPKGTIPSDECKKESER